jgi:hypothetical protein
VLKILLENMGKAVKQTESGSVLMRGRRGTVWSEAAIFERLYPFRQLFRFFDQFLSLSDQKDSIPVQFCDPAPQRTRLLIISRSRNNLPAGDQRQNEPRL